MGNIDPHHTLIQGMVPNPDFRVPYPDFRVQYPDFRIHHFEVNIMMHLDFCYPTVKFLFNHPKKIHWNIEFDDSEGVFFHIMPSKFPHFVSFKGILSNFHMSSQTHIREFLWIVIFRFGPSAKSLQLSRTVSDDDDDDDDDAADT